MLLLAVFIKASLSFVAVMLIAGARSTSGAFVGLACACRSNLLLGIPGNYTAFPTQQSDPIDLIPGAAVCVKLDYHPRRKLVRFPFIMARHQRIKAYGFHQRAKTVIFWLKLFKGRNRK